jgi:4'-phosphopantetheinyl transferase EntD
MIAQILPPSVVAVEATDECQHSMLLPEEEAALGRVVDKRRREFTIARSCARRALGELGFPPTPILPGPSRQPLWPDAVVGSITHGEGYHAAAVAYKRQVIAIGIDAEVDERLPPGVLDYVAVDEERAWLDGLSATETCWDRVLFCAKESIFKAVFPVTGHWLGFDDAVVTMEPESGRFRARFASGDLAVDGHRLTQIDGRYLVEHGRILTAIALERRQ